MTAAQTDPTPVVARARTLLVCSVLAEHFSPLPLRGLDIPTHQVTHTVTVQLRDTRLEYLLGWRSRVTAWSVRWDAARHAAKTYFPDLPGVKEIPDLAVLDELELSDAERAQLSAPFPL
jgi:hypothetical protein